MKNVITTRKKATILSIYVFEKWKGKNPIFPRFRWPQKIGLNAYTNHKIWTRCVILLDSQHIAYTIPMCTQCTEHTYFSLFFIRFVFLFWIFNSIGAILSYNALYVVVVGELTNYLRIGQVQEKWAHSRKHALCVYVCVFAWIFCTLRPNATMSQTDDASSNQRTKLIVFLDTESSNKRTDYWIFIETHFYSVTKGWDHTRQTMAWSFCQVQNLCTPHLP